MREGLVKEDPELISNALTNLKKKIPPESIPTSDKAIIAKAEAKLEKLKENEGQLSGANRK